jgi:hypothetical protein
LKENKSALKDNKRALKDNKSDLKENKRALKDNKSALKENMLQHGHNIAYLQIIQAGLPIYVLLLSGNNCLLYSSIGISFKSITK